MPTQQSATEPEGLVRRMSSFNHTESVRRLHNAISKQRMSVFAEIDHVDAARAGMPLQPTRVLVFDIALAGTPLTQATPTIGIDLQLKVLVWMDWEGITWLAHNDPG